MAKIFKIPKRVLDKVTGKMVNRVNPQTGKVEMGANWHVRIEDWQGRRPNVVLSSNKEEAQREADILVGRQLEIKLGIAPVPTPERMVKKRNITEIIEEYLQWGSVQGGLKGGPWAQIHFEHRRSHLNWWQGALGIKTLREMGGLLGVAEKALHKLAITGLEHPTQKNKAGTPEKPLSGKTLHEYAGALKSFCNWCVERGYLDENPVRKLGGFDKEPQVERRALTTEEMRLLLDASPPYLRLLLETALCTGLRRGELRRLTLDDLNPAELTLRIDRKSDKGRKKRQQSIPGRLAKPLLLFAKSGQPHALYDKYYQGRTGHELAIPERPLLYVPMHAARALKRIAQRAGVPEVTVDGKLDFHGLRTTYINMLIEAGSDAKTVQEMSRHTTAAITFKVYAKAKKVKMGKIADKVGDMLTHTDTGSDEDFGEGMAFAIGKTWTADTTVISRHERASRSSGQRPHSAHTRKMDCL